MGETCHSSYHKGWKYFLRNHWKIAALLIVVAVLAMAGAIYVFVWFAETAQSTGMVPARLGSWSIGHCLSFLIHLVFWEVLLVGIPIILVAIAGWFWWKRTRSKEDTGYHLFGTGSRATTGGSGGVSLLFTIAFAIKVFIDGNWNTPFADWTFSYLVDSMILILIWFLIIFGILATLGIIWWLMRPCKQSKKHLAIHAETLMSPDLYLKTLELVQTGNRTKFQELCFKEIGNITDREVDELWAAAKGCMSTEAQAAYPGSSGW